MLKDKILIIEDNPDEFKLLTSILDDYNVEYYPTNPDEDGFLRLLRKFAKGRLPEYQMRLIEIIKQFDPKYILLDICLEGHNNPKDRSGLIIKKDIINVDFPNATTIYLTHFSDIGVIESHEGYISKNFLESNVKKEFERQKITRKQNAKFGNKSTKFERVVYGWNTYFQEPTQTIADIFIRFSFYLLLIIFMTTAICTLVVKTWKEVFEPIHIAEYAFISFLPLLVTFGFYVFYERSLKQFVVRDNVIIINHEEASQLMSLTKKLFISSLISYLFIKIIELLTSVKGEEHEIFVSNETMRNGSHPNQYKSLLHYIYDINPFYQIGILVLFILALIFYYVQLNKHTPMPNEGGKDAHH